MIDRTQITLPYNFEPRDYQKPVFKAFLQDGCKKGIMIDHRRCGKDKSALNIQVSSIFDRIGGYYYFFPKFKQARRAIWDGRDKDEYPFMNHFPEEIRKKTWNTDMKIETIDYMGIKHEGSSIWQMIGADKLEGIDKIMGSNPVFTVFSEFSQYKTSEVWDLMRPIFLENDGKALFVFTPRGKNHAYKLYKMAKDSRNWYTECLTVNDTYHNGVRLITDEMIQQERDEGMDEDMIQQEFYCNFNASNPGAYYKKQLRRAREGSRICKLAIEPNIEVYTFWDIGIRDATCIWFAQKVGNRIHILDVYYNRGEDLTHYVNYLKGWERRNNVTYAEHILPHDALKHEYQSGITTARYLEDLGLDCNTTLRPSNKTKGINTVRMIFDKCWFDEVKCDYGLEKLGQYRCELLDSNIFKLVPVHDESSHYADAFQTLAMYFRRQLGMQLPEKRTNSLITEIPNKGNGGYRNTVGSRYGFMGA